MPDASRMDSKLQKILAGHYTPADFIIADAKDADMGNPMVGAGRQRGHDGRETHEGRTRAQYRESMIEMVRSGHIDVLLVSASNAEILTNEGAFADNDVKAAIRLNDTTDIWSPRGGRYGLAPSRPFRSANLARARALTDLGLYSITFVNDVEHDLDALEQYQMFRDDAAHCGMRHFLEVFAPNVPCGLDDKEIGWFVVDMIARTLAGLTAAERPLFLKIPYFGERQTRDLATFDPTVPVGVLGGGRGTTRDTFELLARAEAAGARVALFGRKINLAEHPTALVGLMRQVVERVLTPESAVTAYHEILSQEDRVPDRPLMADLLITEPALKD
jgi:DhnA family fructose-bisphosphate aldolase class Ia